MCRVEGGLPRAGPAADAVQVEVLFYEFFYFYGSFVAFLLFASCLLQCAGSKEDFRGARPAADAIQARGGGVADKDGEAQEPLGQEGEEGARERGGGALGRATGADLKAQCDRALRAHQHVPGAWAGMGFQLFERSALEFSWWCVDRRMDRHFLFLWIWNFHEAAPNPGHRLLPIAWDPLDG